MQEITYYKEKITNSNFNTVIFIIKITPVKLKGAPNGRH